MSQCLSLCLSRTCSRVGCHKKNSFVTEASGEEQSGQQLSPYVCLPMMSKLLTGIMREMLQQHLERNCLLRDEQKGCRKGTRRTKAQLLVNKTVQKNSWSMTLIDYKVYERAPYLWLLKCLRMVRAAKNMIFIFSNSMVN